MRGKLFVSLIAFLAASQMGRQALAAPANAPDEKLKTIFDQAMPELMAGKFPDMLREVCSEAILKQLGYGEKFAAAPLPLGGPLDWAYLGAKKCGSSLRQHLYLCRFENGALLWRFTITELNGRSVVFAIQFQQNPRVAFSQVSPNLTVTDNEGSRLADRIADGLVQERREVEELLLPILGTGDSNKQKIHLAAKELAARITLAGGNPTYELVEEKNVGDALLQRTYLVKCPNAFVKIVIGVYRARAEWKANQFHYQYEPSADDLMATSVLQTDAKPTYYQAARGSKADQPAEKKRP